MTSDFEVAGFQFIKTPGGDLLGMNGLSTSEQLTNLYFPQVAVLGPWETNLGLVNYSTEPVISDDFGFQTGRNPLRLPTIYKTTR